MSLDGFDGEYKLNFFFELVFKKSHQIPPNSSYEKKKLIYLLVFLQICNK